MAKRERVKGAVAEREVRDILRAHGFACNRDGSVSGDLKDDLPEGYHFEVKRQETLSLPAWTRQAEEDAGDRIPVVVYRASRQPWRVSMPLVALLELLQRTTNREEPLAGNNGSIRPDLPSRPCVCGE